MSRAKRRGVFYGWWIVAAAFVNLFFTTGIVAYGLPVFYVPLIRSLGFNRQQVTSGLFFGAILVAPLFGLLAGVLIDRVGPRGVILCGIGFAGLSMLFLGMISSLAQYYLLSMTEVVGYVLAGPIPNQIVIVNWFRRLRGRAMGYAYLGLGLGGAVSPLLIHFLIAHFGWRRAFELIGAAMVLILFPVGIWITRSYPREMGLLPDGADVEVAKLPHVEANPVLVRRAIRTPDFWLLLAGSSLVLWAISTVIAHFILFLTDAGHTLGWASRALSLLLGSSLVGRVTVGYLADRFTRKNVMALFYLVLALSIPLLLVHNSNATIFVFAVIFGFALGADYMLIPLVAADCFGLASLGKLLALIIMTDTLVQSSGPVMAGHIFDTRHSYHLVWEIITVGGLVGALAIYLISTERASRATSRA